MPHYAVLKPKVQKITRRGARGLPGDGSVQRGIIRLDSPDTTTMTDADTWYPVLGVFIDGLNLGFSLATDGVLTHSGASGVFLMNGVSNVAVNKACKLTYGTYIDGVIVPRSESSIDFPSQAKTGLVGITDLVSINQGQTLQVHMKADTANVVASLDTLKVTLWGGY